MTATIAITATTSRPGAIDAPDTVISIVGHEPAALSRWGQYAERSPLATLFHQPFWCEIVQEVFGHRPCHLIAERAGRVVGILPLMEIRSILAGRLLVSVPYATYGGILSDDDDVRDALASRAARLADEQRARSLELRSARAEVPGFSHENRYGAFLRALPDSPEQLATFLPRKSRAAVRQARRREKLTVRHDAADLAIVWRLYSRSMRRLASINYPYRFFQELAARLREHAWVTTVWHGERPVAGLLSFVFRDTVMPYFVGVDERVSYTGTANLLYASLMERAVEHGLGRFDFGRTRRDNSGPWDFKRNQGFEPCALGYQRDVPAGRTAPDLTPTNPCFRLARRLWPRLPLPITRVMGSWLSAAVPG